MKTLSVSAMAMVALLAGCASTSNTGQGPGMGMMAEKCPMQVAGTTVTAVDVEDGAAIAFTTTGDVAELRQRVRGMAEMHEHHHAAGGKMMGDGKRMGDGKMMGVGKRMGDGKRMPAAEATAEDTAGGARIVLRPEDPAELEALREHARMHAKKMSSGECAMMSPGAPTTTPTGASHANQ